jgi:hypothetical protein
MGDNRTSMGQTMKYAALVSKSVTIPGGERSRTNPSVTVKVSP